MLSGVQRKSTVILVWIAAVFLCRFRVLSRRFNVLNFWGAICGPSGLDSWVLLTLMWSSLLAGCLIMDLCLKHCLWRKVVILLLLSDV